MFYAVLTARVIFIVKTSVDVFSNANTSVLGDCISEMKRVTESGQQGIKT